MHKSTETSRQIKWPISNALVISHFIEGNRVFEDYCKGIKAQGGQCYFIDYIEQYIADGKDGFERRIENLVLEKDIDCIFFIWWSSDLTFELSFLERLSSQTMILINYFDTEYFFEGVDRYYAQLADLVILPDHLAKYKYEQLNLNALTTFAMYDKNSYKNDRAEKDIDVSFVGNLTQSNRRELFDYLRSNGISAQASGVGSENGFVTFREMVGVFNRSKINLNFTAISDSKNYAVSPPTINQRIRQSKGRPIEIALSGGFVLSEYAPGIEAMFSIGQEMDVFTTKEELLAKVHFYLSHDVLRAEIAERGHKRALRDYDSTAGFAKVFERLATLGRSANKTAYVDSEFIENFTAYRFFYLAVLFLNGRFKHMLVELRVVLSKRHLNIKKSVYFAIKGFLYFMREHPRMERKMKSIKKKFNIHLKY